ncbi:MAG: dihydropyrimidine dehydrogenase, partial [Mucinivorans sp.]
MTEASRCLNCKKPLCREACPVSVQIPDFIAQVAAGNIAAAATVIAKDNLLPSICGR